MNDLTVIQASQGLCRNAETQASHSPTFNVDGLLCSYLESQGIAEKGVVIGYDGRHNSKDFAVRVRCASDFSPESIPLGMPQEWTAAVFIHRGVRVYMFGEMTPTPFVPFGVKLFGAASRARAA